MGRKLENEMMQQSMTEENELVRIYKAIIFFPSPYRPFSPSPFRQFAPSLFLLCNE